MIEGQPSIYQTLEAEGKALAQQVVELTTHVAAAAETITKQNEAIELLSSQLKRSTDSNNLLLEFIKSKGFQPPPTFYN